MLWAGSFHLYNLLHESTPWMSAGCVLAACEALRLKGPQVSPQSCLDRRDMTPDMCLAATAQVGRVWAWHWPGTWGRAGGRLGEPTLIDKTYIWRSQCDRRKNEFIHQVTSDWTITSFVVITDHKLSPV